MHFTKNGTVWSVSWPLQLAFSGGGLDGLTQLLSEKVDGKARVTATKRIIGNLGAYLEKGK